MRTRGILSFTSGVSKARVKLRSLCNHRRIRVTVASHGYTILEAGGEGGFNIGARSMHGSGEVMIAAITVADNHHIGISRPHKTGTLRI